MLLPPLLLLMLLLPLWLPLLPPGATSPPQRLHLMPSDIALAQLANGSLLGPG